MGKLLLVCFSALLLVAISDSKSTCTIDETGIRRYIHKENLFFFFASVILAVFVGLRKAGNDTGTYRRIYELTSADLTAFKIDWQNISGAPGLKFVVACLRNLGATSQDYLMVMALFTVITYMRFLHRYSNDLLLSVYLFITMGVYLFTGAAIKQTAAMAILTIATDRALRGKNRSFLFWVILAEFFHPYSFIYLIIPFLFFPPWTSKTWFLLLGTVVVALGLSFFLRGMLEVTEALGYSVYTVSTFSGSGVSVFRLLVVSVPVIISFAYKETIWENNDRIANCIINASMICAMIMFIGLFGTANYFARLANYFLIFQIISLPYLIRLSKPSNRKTFTYLAVILFFLYFYYENNVVRGRFNARSYLSLIDFIRQI